MLWLIAFDISDNKARRRAVKILEGYGERVQYSVFECLLKRHQLRRIQRKMLPLIEESDKVMYYPICGKDILQRYADGTGKIHWPAALHIVDD